MSKELFEEMVSQQEERLFRLGQRIVPHLTREDILQPNDFIELENHPLFRYEEGVLEGLRSALTAYLVTIRDEECCK